MPKKNLEKLSKAKRMKSFEIFKRHAQILTKAFKIKEKLDKSHDEYLGKPLINYNKASKLTVMDFFKTCS